MKMNSIIPDRRNQEIWQRDKAPSSPLLERMTGQRKMEVLLLETCDMMERLMKNEMFGTPNTQVN